MQYQAGEELKESDDATSFSYTLDLHPNYWLHVDESGMKIFERRFILPSPKEPVMESDFVVQKGDRFDWNFSNEDSFYLSVHRDGKIVFEWYSDGTK